MGWFSNLFSSSNTAPSAGVTPAAGSVPADAASRNLAVGSEAAAFNNANGAYTRPLLDNANSTAARVGGVQADNMDFSRGVGQEAMDFQTGTFRPLQRGLVADATGYDTAARRESEAGLAMARTGSQIDAETEGNNRMLASRGVDPSSGASLSMARRGAVMGGAAKAAAGNQARLQVEDTGFKRRMDANTMGNQLTGNALAASGQSVAAGSAAVNTAAAPLQLQTQQTQQANSLFGTQIAANNSAGNIMQPAGAGARPGNDGTSQALGALAGAAASYYGGKAKGGEVGLADMRGPTQRGMVNLDVGEYRFSAKHAKRIGVSKLLALNEGRAVVVMKRA